MGLGKRGTVDEPICKSPALSRLITVPPSVTADPPGIIDSPCAITNPFGAAVKTCPPTVKIEFGGAVGEGEGMGYVVLPITIPLSLGRTEARRPEIVAAAPPALMRAPFASVTTGSDVGVGNEDEEVAAAVCRIAPGVVGRA